MLRQALVIGNFCDEVGNIVAKRCGKFGRRRIRILDRIVENRAEDGNDISAGSCLRYETRDFGQMIDIRLFRLPLPALIAVLAGREIDGAHELDDVALRDGRTKAT